MSPLQVRMVQCFRCLRRVTVARAEPLQVNNRAGLWICKKCAQSPEVKR